MEPKVLLTGKQALCLYVNYLDKSKLPASGESLEWLFVGQILQSRLLQAGELSEQAAYCAWYCNIAGLEENHVDLTFLNANIYRCGFPHHFLWNHGFSTSFCVFTLGYNENSHFSMAPNFEELTVIRKCAMASSEGNRWDPWNAMEYPEKDDGPLDHWILGYPILSQSSKPNLLCPRSQGASQAVIFCWGGDDLFLEASLGLIDHAYSLKLDFMEIIPLYTMAVSSHSRGLLRFFGGMLYSYTDILEVKLLAGPKGAGNQPDVIILYVNIYIYILFEFQHEALQMGQCTKGFTLELWTCE